MSTSSSSLPVVWCADRNSVDNKPTAFALQGIHLQGNISEQHVLAVRELINAASEGRLLLPADGGVVVLSCGVGVGSLIVSSNENSLSELNKTKEICNIANTIENNNDASKTTNGKDEDERIRPNFHINTSSEVLYEFLCCARCMSEGSKCNGKLSQNSKIIEKYLDAKINAARAMRRTGVIGSKPLKNRKRTKTSFKSEKRILKRMQPTSVLPIYATVNKKEKIKNSEIKTTESENANSTNAKVKNDVIETTLTAEVVQISSTFHESFRKTSFDSTCTVSSMDSGFIEMQNKAELGRKGLKVQISSTETVQINIEPPEKADDFAQNIEESANKVESLSTWNRLTIPQQSRNRRKSYEEFKSLFCDQKNSLLNVNESKNSSKSRRKSYEEFKSATINTINKNDSSICDDNKSSGNESLTINKNNSSNENLSTFFSRMRRGSKRLSQKSNTKTFVSSSNSNCNKNSSSNHNNFKSNIISEKSINEEQQRDISEFTIYDILRKNEQNSNNINNINLLKANNVIKRNYDKNLELFENHCNEQNNKHNTKSCGTIYDIIQKRNDIYSKSCKKYDKYMTYGTLYEILHRKSDEGDQFDRKRTFSEKYSNKQRINYDFIKASSIASQNNANVINSSNNNIGLFKKVSSSSNVTDISEENLNSSSTSASASSLKQGSCNTNNQLSITSVNSKQLSTIYDILQTKKLDTSISIQTNNKNRFLVRKITEEELFEFQKESDNSSNNNSSSHMNNNNINDLNSISNNANDTKISLNMEETTLSCNNDQKKQTKLRRFSNILSYAPKTINELNATKTIDTHSDIETKLDIKIDEIYSRLNRINTVQINKNNHVQQQTQQKASNSNQAKSKNEGSMYKSNSLDMLSTTEDNHEFVKKIPLRKISVPAHLPPKILPKKNTRRLSEFTRGEFLNEKL